MALPKQPQSSTAKEQKETQLKPSPEQVEYWVAEQKEALEVPKALKKVAEAVGAEVTLPKPVTGKTGAVIVDTPAPQQVTVQLPATDEEVQEALHLKIIHSFRWLAEWIKRVRNLVGNKFVYKLKK